MLHGKWRISRSPWVGIAEQFQGESSCLLCQLADCLHTVHHPVLGDQIEAAAETDFGQSDFGHPCWPTLAKSDFGQADFGPSWCFSHLGAQKGGGPEGWGPRRVGPRRVGPEGWGPEGWVPPKFRAFSSLSHHRFALFVSLWVSSRGILVVFEAPEPSIVHVWSSRVVV